jgi:hypothetical protein
LTWWLMFLLETKKAIYSILTQQIEYILIVKTPNGEKKKGRPDTGNSSFLAHAFSEHDPHSGSHTYQLLAHMRQTDHTRAHSTDPSLQCHCRRWILDLLIQSRCQVEHTENTNTQNFPKYNDCASETFVKKYLALFHCGRQEP